MSVKSKTAIFRDLLYLQQVIACRRLNAAAEKNGIKASNLSNIIKQMEQRFNKQLFYRNPQGLTPTTDALEIMSGFENIEQLFNRFCQQIDPSLPPSAVKLFIPNNLQIRGLADFATQNNLIIGESKNQKTADVIVSYTEPHENNSLVSVENHIGKEIQQTIWVCAINQENPLKLARFIIGQMHSQ